jgi:hypothetical protein
VPSGCRREHIHSERSAEVAALSYARFESAKLAGIDPYGYVLEAIRRAIASPGAVILAEDLA